MRPVTWLKVEDLVVILWFIIFSCKHLCHFEVNPFCFPPSVPFSACLNSLVRNSSVVCNGSLGTDIWAVFFRLGKVFSVSLLNIMIVLGFLMLILSQIEEVHFYSFSIPTSLSCFFLNHKWVLTFVKCLFFLYWNHPMFCPPCSWGGFYWFLNVRTPLHF